jgi:hypothetical protein
VLLTDGAPNCNAAFSPTAANCDPTSQRCVSPGACFGEPGAPLGCLDEDATVAAVRHMHDALGTRTFVIGFGADFGDGSLATETLNQMALAGGLAKPQDDGGTSTAFYRAQDLTGLTQSFASVRSSLRGHCSFQLSQAAPPRYFSLEISATGTASVSVPLSQVQVDGLHVSIADSATCTGLSGREVTFTFRP